MYCGHELDALVPAGVAYFSPNFARNLHLKWYCSLVHAFFVLPTLTRPFVPHGLLERHLV